MACTVRWAHQALTVSALAFATASALAQTPQQREVCCRTSAADDQTISGCTAVIQGGKESQDNLAIAYYNRGIGYQNSKDYELALKDYDQALRLRPAYSSASNNRGNVFQSLRQYERAVQDYDQATRIAPNDPLPYNNRGNAYRRLGKTDKAIAELDQAIRLKPDYADATVA